MDRFPPLALTRCVRKTVLVDSYENRTVGLTFIEPVEQPANVAGFCRELVDKIGNLPVGSRTDGLKAPFVKRAEFQTEAREQWLNVG